MKIYLKATKKGKKNRTECTVFGALELTLRISNWLGMAPLTFVNEGGRVKISVTNTMCLYRYFLLALFNATIITALITDTMTSKAHSVRVDSNVTEFIWVIDVFIMAILSTVGISTSPSRMKDMICYINQINKTELNNGREYFPKQRKKCIAVIVVLIGGAMVFTWETGILIYEADIYSKEHTLVNNYGAIMQKQFISFLSKSINIITDSIPVMNKIGNFQSAQSIPTATGLRRLTITYAALCDVVRQMNRTNGVMLVILLLSLLHIVMTPYYFILHIIGATKMYNRMCLIVAYSVLHSIELILVAESGHRIAKEIKQTQVLIVEMMLQVRSMREPFGEELVLFQKELALNSPSYEPLGVCVLGRQITVTVLGSVATYIVILVQFRTKK